MDGFFAGEVLRMDIFLDGGIEKGLIIRERYWGLKIPASEACGDKIS